MHPILDVSDDERPGVSSRSSQNFILRRKFANKPERFVTAGRTASPHHGARSSHPVPTVVSSTLLCSDSPRAHCTRTKPAWGHTRQRAGRTAVPEDWTESVSREMTARIYNGRVNRRTVLHEADHRSGNHLRGQVNKLGADVLLFWSFTV